jgi:hypothetical protein
MSFLGALEWFIYGCLFAWLVGPTVALCKKVWSEIKLTKQEWRQDQ